MAAAATASAASASRSSTITASEWVHLECVKEGSRLRVRILTPGYYHDANCQFPRSIREPGRKYRAKSTSVKLITSRGKWFYSVPAGAVEVLDEGDAAVRAQLTVFEDATSSECAVCMAVDKDTVLDPCGHLYMCRACSEKVRECPICRVRIARRINKADMA